MNNDSVAFWAAILCSNSWAASSNQYSTVMAAVWGVFAVLIFAAAAAAREEKKTYNARVNSAAEVSPATERSES